MNLKMEFDNAAAAVPSYANADAALRKAKSRRRGRIAASVTAGVLALAVVPIGAMAMSGGETVTPADGAGDDAALAMQIDDTHVLWPDGETTVELPEPIAADAMVVPGSLFMTPSGLVTVGESSLYLVHQDGEADSLDFTEPVEHVRVSDDGGKVAWGNFSGGKVFSATITDSGFESTHESAAPEEAYPLGWAGDQVVVTQPAFEGMEEGWILWDGAAELGDQWNIGTMRIYGMTADDQLLARGIRDEANCLLLLDPASGTDTDTQCGDEFFPPPVDENGSGSPDRLSPDGKRVFNAQAGTMYDVAELFESGTPPESTGVSADEAEWLDDTTVVLRSGDQLTYFDVTSGEKNETSGGGKLIPEFGV